VIVDKNLKVIAGIFSLNYKNMFYYPSFKKIFSTLAFILLMGCPCIACEESPVVQEFLYHGERKRSGINGSMQYLKEAFSKLLRTIISDKTLVLQSIFKFSTSSLPTTHYNPYLVSVSSTILLL